jgi:Uma2 family endonuclease
MTVVVDNAVPPLEAGDRLSRAEFERRYAAMPHLKKAELIEGVVYMASAVRLRAHGEPHSLVMTWLGVYRASTPGVRIADNTSLRLDGDNEPQPDAMLFVDPACGGRVNLSEDDYVEGAPELIVEVASSSASYDRHDKLRAYRRNGVQEYLLWLVQEARIEWYALTEGEYRLLDADSEGVVHSRVFPGLCLAIPAMLADGLSIVLERLQRCLQTLEHEAFVARLRPSA